jgi:enoyl-CoA hydratase/carnithine racemase
MTPPKLPASYNDFHLPEIKLLHHPEDYPVVTPVIQVLMDRPAQKNSFTDVMGESLTQAFRLLSADPRVRCLVLSSTDATNKFFCAGMDLGDAARHSGTPPTAAKKEEAVIGPRELARQREAHRDGGAQLSLAVYACTKPIVAALNGHGVGVGMTMTLPCNIRIASSEGKYGFVFARRGINSMFYFPLGLLVFLHVCPSQAAPLFLFLARLTQEDARRVLAVSFFFFFLFFPFVFLCPFALSL